MNRVCAQANGWVSFCGGDVQLLGFFYRWWWWWYQCTVHWPVPASETHYSTSTRDRQETGIDMFPTLLRIAELSNRIVHVNCTQIVHKLYHSLTHNNCIAFSADWFHQLAVALIPEWVSCWAPAPQLTFILILEFGFSFIILILKFSEVSLYAAISWFWCSNIVVHQIKGHIQTVRF